MGGFGGAYSRDPRTILDEEKGIIQVLHQTDVPWVDADLNLSYQALWSIVRRLQQTIGDGSLDDGLKIVGDDLSNDFIVKGGDGTVKGAGTLFIQGYKIIRVEDVLWDNDGSTLRERLIHPMVTGVTEIVLFDASANYLTDELVGRELQPNIQDPTTFTIVSNTATTITVDAGDLTTVAQTGDHYKVKLTTPPCGDRVDKVWLNAYLDEVDSIEDPSIVHSVEGQDIECGRLLVLRYSIHVREGDATEMTDYTDSDGNEHHLMLIATLNRADTNSIITSVMVEDDRPVITFGGGGAGGRNTYQEVITAENVVGADVTLAQQLEHEPSSATAVKLYRNKLLETQGEGLDYVMSGAQSRQITILADTGTALDMTDDELLVAVYESFE